MPIASVEDILKSLFTRLPTGISAPVLSALALFSWLSAPLNFLSQISHIELVIAFWQNLLSKLQVLEPLLVTVGRLLTPILAAWRATFEPIRVWLQNSLHIDV